MSALLNELLNSERRLVELDADQQLAREAAAALDRVRPGWFRAVHLGSLDMQHPHRCVLGQVFGDYGDGLRVLWEAQVPERLTRAFHSDFSRLLWVRQVLTRRDRVGATP